MTSRAPGPGLAPRAPSSVLVLGAVASVQFGSALATSLFSQVGPGGAVTLRLVAAAVALLMIWRPRLHQGTTRQWGLVLAFGLALAGMNLSFYEALARIPLGIAVTIEFVGPLAVGVLGSRRPIDVLWVALAAAGILALTHGATHHLSGVGVAFGLGAGACWGAYILLQARLGRAFTGGQGLAVAMAVAALAALPIGIVQGGPRLIAPHEVALGAAVGMLSSAIPYSLELEALRRIATAVFGVLMSLEPAVAALAGFIVLGQGLGMRELAGIALVVLASGGASRSARAAPVAA